jgi:hypothetical protein
MLQSTLDTAKALLKTDQTLTVTDRQQLVTLLRSHGRSNPEKTTSAPPEVRLVRRAEVARRLGLSLRSVDNLAKSGVLRKVRLPGRTRSAGIRESDLVTLISTERAPE